MLFNDMWNIKILKNSGNFVANLIYMHRLRTLPNTMEKMFLNYFGNSFKDA